MNIKHRPISFIRELLEGKSELEIIEAEQRFIRYFEILSQIYDRVHKDDP
jgi:hypothetical protein